MTETDARGKLKVAFMTQTQRAYHQATRGIAPPKIRQAFEDEAESLLAEVERAAAEEAWESGVATALNYAKRGSDGISLKLVTFDGEAWTNPYRRKEA